MLLMVWKLDPFFQYCLIFDGNPAASPLGESMLNCDLNCRVDTDVTLNVHPKVICLSICFRNVITSPTGTDITLNKDSKVETASVRKPLMKYQVSLSEESLTRRQSYQCSFERRCVKTGLQGFQPGPTQTGAVRSQKMTRSLKFRI